MPLLGKETEVFPEGLFDPTDTSPWLVVHVRSRQEKKLARHLEQNGVPFYLPQIEKTTRRARRTFTSYVPLFPGYVFMRELPLARDVARRSNTVAGLIEVDDQDLVARELRQLRELQLRGASLTPHLDVKVGVSVRVSDGVFAGYTGVVVKEKGVERLIVTISHLHRAVAVDLRRDMVARQTGQD